MHLSGPVPQQAAYGAAVNEPRQRGVDPDVAENFTQMRSCADGCGRHCPGRMWQRGIGASRRDSPYVQLCRWHADLAEHIRRQ